MSMSLNLWSQRRARRRIMFHLQDQCSESEQRNHGHVDTLETRFCLRIILDYLPPHPPTNTNPRLFLQTPPLLLLEPVRNRCAAHFASFHRGADKTHRVTLPFPEPGALPCPHCPARRSPLFVPEEAALRWLPPTPSSYCSGLVEWGRIRHLLTIALLNTNHATDGHRQERETG